jgi:hypothetical protein
MPRYRFNIYNGTGLTEDEEGRELASDDAIRAEALKGIRSILGEDIMSGVLDLRGRLEILDEAGDLYLTVPFADAVTIIGASAQG